MRKEVVFLSFIVMIPITIVVYIYDAFIIVFIEQMRNVYLDYLFLNVHSLSNIFIIFSFVLSLFLFRAHKRRWAIPISLSILLSAGISFILKILIKRPRPFHEGLVSVLTVAFHFMKNNFNTWNFSFPSFHAMVVFSVLPLITKEFPRFRYLWIIFAVLVGLSKTYFGVHYLSDVLVGALIGYTIGLGIVWFEEKKGYGSKTVQKLRIG